MLRGAMNLLTAVSLVLFLACAAAFVRAGWTGDHVELNFRGPLPGTYRAFDLNNSIGGFTLIWSFQQDPRARPFVQHYRTLRRSAYDRKSFRNEVRIPGLGYDDANGRVGCGALFVSHWLVAVITLALPLRVLVRRLEQFRRDREGKCAVCGYDLRATPDRCPECGSPATPPSDAWVSRGSKSRAVPDSWSVSEEYPDSPSF